MCVKRFRIRVVAIVSALMLAVAFAVPASAQNESNSSQYEMALLLSTLNNPYFVAMKEAAQKKAKHLDVDLQVLDANNDSNTQISQIQTLIAKQVDMLLVNPTNAAAVTPAIKQANEAGVPVIFVDRATKGGDALAFFASDNVQAGKIACRFLVEHMNGEGTIAILMGVPGASATIERSKGCKQVLANKSNVEVVARQTAQFDRAEALNVMQNILTANPQGVDAVFAQNDSMALGAIQALKSANALDDTLIASIDGTKAGRKAVKAGTLELTVAQQPALMAKWGVVAGYNYLQNGRLFVPVPLKAVTSN